MFWTFQKAGTTAKTGPAPCHNSSVVRFMDCITLAKYEAHIIFYLYNNQWEMHFKQLRLSVNEIFGTTTKC